MPAVTATAPRTAQVDLSLPVTHAAPRRRCNDTESCERGEAPAPRRNPLVSAMMLALSGLMPKAAPASAQDGTPAPAKAGEAAPSGELKDAAMAFAHELFNALRTLGGGRAEHGQDRESSGDDRGRAHGHHHHHGHHRGYGNLAQRLEQLAGTVQTPPAAAKADSAAGLSMTASLTTASFTTTSDAATGSTSAAVNLSMVSLSLQQQTAAVAPAESPLLGAFRKLFDALQPAAAPGTARPDAASSLASFLRQLASSLRAGRDEAAAAAPTQGSLISVTA
jgi:hypothetical protein